MGAENLQEVRIMKPQFANVFNVSVNDNRSECSLSFYHFTICICSTITRPSPRA